VVANDGHSQVTLPDGWDVKSQPPHGVCLSAVNNKGATGFAVTTTAKSAVANDTTYRDYAVKWTNFLVKDKCDVTMSVADNISVGGRPGVQYRITYVEPSPRVRICIVHITVDGENHFHQLIFSMGDDKYKQTRPAIDAIVSSFQELP